MITTDDLVKERKMIAQAVKEIEAQLNVNRGALLIVDRLIEQSKKTDPAEAAAPAEQ